MILIGNVFPKLRRPKNVLRYLSKISSFRGTFEGQHGKRALILLQYEGQHHFIAHSAGNSVDKSFL